MMKRILIILTTLFFIFFLAAFSYLQTSHAKKLLLNTVTQLIEKATDTQVNIESVSFQLPLKLDLRNIQIGKDDIVFGTVEKLEISPEINFREKNLSLNALCLENVDIINLPKKTTSNIEFTPIQQNFWDLISLNINLKYISVKNLNVNLDLLPPDFLDDTFPLNLSGSLFVNSKEHSIKLETTVKRAQESENDNTHIQFELYGYEKKEFTLKIYENSQGILSYAADLGIPYDMLLSLNGIKNINNEVEGQFLVHFLNEESKETSETRSLKGAFSYYSDLIKIHSLNGILGHFSASGTAEIHTKDLTVDNSQFKLFIDDLAGVIDTSNLNVKGRVESTILLNGNLLDPKIELSGRAFDFSINDEIVDDFLLKAHLQKINDNLSGNAFLNASYNNTLLDISTQLLWIEDKITFSNLKSLYGSINVSGDVSYLFKNKGFKGYLNGTLDNFKTVKHYSNRDINGSLDFKTTFDCLAKEQNIDLFLNMKDLYFESASLKSLKLESHLVNIFKKPTGSIKIEGFSGFCREFSFEKVIFDTYLEKENLYNQFSFALKNSDKNIFSTEILGTYLLKENDFNLKINSSHGYFKNFFYELSPPFAFRYQPSLIELKAFKMNFDEGNISLEASVRDENVHTRVNFTKIPLDAISLDSFVPLKGYAEGELLLNGTPLQLTGFFNTKLAELKIDDKAFINAPFFQSEIKTEILKDKIIANGEINGITQEKIRISLEAPITTTLKKPFVEFDENGPIHASLSAVGEISPLLQLLSVDTTSISGKTTLKLDLKGSYVNPELSGLVHIQDGTFESLETGAVFKNLNALFEARGNTLTLKNFSAVDLNEGTIQGQGVLELDMKKKFPFVLNTNLSNISLLNQDFVKAVASGDLKIAGSTESAKVSGNLKTNSIKITISEESQSISKSVDVKYINYKEGEIIAKPQEVSIDYPVELDVHIDAEQNATINSQDLSSSWQGHLNITGYTHTPLFHGDFKIIKGEYNFNGKIFDIKEGVISFGGELDKKTSLYVIVSKDLGKIVAEVILKGPVKNPSISFRSNPPLSQREILSYLLFGRASQDITPFQGSELSQSIKDLTKGKKNKGPDVLTKIRNSIGIDQIDINKTEGNESNEVSVQVGKYISKNILVSVNKSITSEVNQVAVEAKLLPNIKCEAQVGDDSSARLQLRWKRDY